MTPAQANALLDDGDGDGDGLPHAPVVRRRPAASASREGWTRIRSREDWDAAIAGAPREGAS